MAQTYNNTIDFASGFNVLQTGPLDSRLVVDSVENLTDGSIKAPYEGMVVNIKGTPALYILTKPGIENSKNFDNWKLVVGETSPYNIPIMTMEMYNDAINDKSTIFDETKDYILMDDGTTTLGETRNEQIILEDGSVHNGYNIKTPVGTYLDVMLKSIRRLQQEVNKLKNSFDYGICSMTEGNTGSGVIQDKLKDVIEQEPIWAIDTDYLSELDLSLVLTSADCALEPKDNWMMSDDNTTIKVSDECGYEFAEESAYIGETKEIYCVRYTPNDNDWDIKFTFNDTDEDEDKENKWSYELSMKDYLGETNYSNLMLVVDRHEKEEKVKDEDGNVVKDENGDDKVQYKSKSYIYISVSDEKTNHVGRTGYIDIVNNELKELETRFEHRFNITGVYFKNVDIYKAGFYVKDSTYTNEETIPEKEITDDFKYEVSHLTIRSVKTKATLTKYASRFLNNELIFCEENSR